MIYLIWLQKASGRKQTWRSADCVHVRGGFNSLVSLHLRAAALASGHQPHALILHVCKITLKLSKLVLGAHSLWITWCWYFLLGSKTIGFRAPGWVPYLCLEDFFVAKACLWQSSICVWTALWELSPSWLTINGSFTQKVLWNTYFTCRLKCGPPEAK